MVVRRCNQCGKTFNKTEHYKRHERSHTRERPYQCTVCSKAFSRSDVLFRHMKCHNNNNNNQQRPSTSRTNSVANVTGEPFESLASANATVKSSNEQTSAAPLVQVLRWDNTGTTTTSPHQNALPANNSSPTMSHRRQSTATPYDHAPALPMTDSWKFSSPLQESKNSNSVIPQQNVLQAVDTNSMNMFGTPMPNGMDALQAHTVHTNPSIHSQHENHFGWPDNDAGLGDDPNDPLHMWLFPPNGDLEHNPHLLHLYSLNPSTHHTPRPMEPRGPPSGRYSDSSDRTMTISKVPRERFGRVEKTWKSNIAQTQSFLPMLWHEVLSNPPDRVDAKVLIEHSQKEGSNWGLDAESRQRLEQTFHKQIQTALRTPMSPTTAHTEKPLPFPPAEILDVALSLYFRRFHPSMPLVHMPTFCVKTTPLPLLYCICLIGLSILGTTGASDFVVRAFDGFLQHVCTELASCMSQTVPLQQRLTIFTTAVLTLNLAAITGNKDCLSQSQSLYASLLAITQQHGVFVYEGGSPIDPLLASIDDQDRQWRAWCKIESSKRLVISLILIDAWYANHFSVSPTLRSESVQVMVPCDETLFKAQSHVEWKSLLQRGRRLLDTTVSLNQLQSLWTDQNLALDSFGTTGLLSLISIRILDSYHRLLVSSDFISTLVPWRKYASDPQACSLSSIVLSSSHVLRPNNRNSDVNAAVHWNSLCIMLLANFKLFELAAGRRGADPGIEALDEIAQWSQTPSARRACVHAAQNFRLMSNRRVSDVVTIHSVSALFESALVLGLYIFMVQPTTPENEPPTYEILDVDVNWTELNDLAMTDNSMEVQARRDSNMIESSDQTAVSNFIRFGGTLLLSGVAQHGGYESARRILMDFAALMDGISGKKSHTFTQVLHIMSDDLNAVDVMQ